ncbi:MAG TPA: nuclear transport factor 2 family protein [Chitinophagaceae bacterium]|nr:nuclear transport factor 2 family protein [Chitinophagaceae bacterium]
MEKKYYLDSKNHLLKSTSLIAFCLLFNTISFCQTDKKSELFKTLKTKDSLLFNVGFNTCDINQFEKLLSEDVEMYHDQGGLTKTKNDFIRNTREGLCKLSYQPIRRLVEGSLNVFALEKNGVLYGAIQQGIHRFYAKEKDKKEYFTSKARFSHVWILENGEWKLSRILSYDHQTKDF